MMLDGILGLANTLIDRVFPDQKSKDEARLKLLEMQQSGELELKKIEMSAIIAEAQSADKWTSRARPSFLYVMYILLGFSLVNGFIYVVNPSWSAGIATGFGDFLKAIPDSLYALFGAGYLGYSASRTVDKAKGGK